MNSRTLYRSRSGHLQAAVVDELVITVMTADPIDSEWIELMEWGNHPAIVASLAYNPSGRVSAKQRKIAAASMGNRKMKRIALLSDSAVVRGALTAMAWLIPGKTKYRTFKPTASSEAIGWLAQEIRFEPATAAKLLSEMCEDGGKSLASAATR